MTVPNLRGEAGAQAELAWTVVIAVSADSLTILAVDDERTQLEDLARLLRSFAGASRRSSAPTTATTRWSKASTPGATTRSSSTCGCPTSTASSWGGCCGGSRRRPQLVFVSAYDSAAVDAFELHALDYLRKPVSRRRLEEALERVAAAVEAAAAAEPTAGAARRRRRRAGRAR